MARPEGTGEIDQSEHRDEIRWLICNGWSSLAIESYLLQRYGLALPARTIRWYRQNHVNKDEIVQRQIDDTDLDVDSLLDVVTKRANLIRLQQERVTQARTIEGNIGMLLPQESRELALLNDLLTDYKKDLQDIGVFPASPVKIEGKLHTSHTEREEKVLTLREVVAVEGDNGDHELRLAARTIGRLALRAGNGNGGGDRPSGVGGDTPGDAE